MSRNGAMGGRVFVALVALAALAALGARGARACTCSEQPIEDKLRAADAVLRGTIADAVMLTDPRCDDDGVPVQRRYAIDVASVWRGDTGRRAVLATEPSSGACGLPDLDVGTERIFLAVRIDGALQLHTCAGTLDATEAATVDAVLGDAHAPRDDGGVVRVRGRGTCGGRTRGSSPS